MRIKLLVISMLLGIIGLRAQSDSLKVYYYQNAPYAFSDGSELRGIEIDILKEYISWLKERKRMNVAVSYKPFTEFSAFYAAVREGGSKVVGLGSVSVTKERESEVSFSAPYLRNVAVMITSGTVPTIKSRNAEDARPVLDKMSAVLVKSSSHSAYVENIKKEYAPSLKISYTETQDKVLESIIGNPAAFGFVDVVAYWTFLKKHSGKYLKMQKAFREPREYLSYIMPKNGTHTALLNEFFESGFGFTSTRAYHQILEKYLGYEVLSSVGLD